MRFLLIFLVFLVISNPVQAEGPTDEKPVSTKKQMVWDEQRFDKYLPFDLFSLAEKVLLGIKYERNSKLAERMFQMSYRKDPTLAWLIGITYQNRLVDLAGAVPWFLKAVSDGDEKGKKSLGRIFWTISNQISDHSTMKNSISEESLAWLMASAQMGIERAIIELDALYYLTEPKTISSSKDIANKIVDNPVQYISEIDKKK